jgi:adenylate kinase family enzyme
MRRVVIIGNSGSGKTTLAREVAGRLELPHLELDAVYHQPGWVPLPEPEFRRRITDFTDAEGWVVDGDYTSVGTREVVWPRADAIVWLDLPLRIVMGRVTARTLRRAWSGVELWNGNREPRVVFLDPRPDRNIVLYALVNHRRKRREIEAATSDPGLGEVNVWRLRSTSQVTEFLRSLE